MPIYSRIKGLIKHLKKSEERDLIDDYNLSRAKLTQSLRGKALEEKLAKMEAIYEKLLLKIRQDSLAPSRLISELSERFLIFYNILHLWKDYTGIMKKTPTELFAEVEASNEQSAFQQTDAFKNMDYTSPDEKMTSEEEESDSSLDFERIKAMMKKDLQKLEKEISEAKRKEREQAETAKSEGPTLIEGVLKETQAEETTSATAEQEWAEMGDSPSLYGITQDSKLTKAKDFLLKTNIEKIFPSDLIAQSFEFNKPALDFEEVAEMRVNHKATLDTNPDSLNGSVFIDGIKETLLKIDQTALTTKDKKTLADLVFLLERIGEVKISEARLLGRLFDML